LFGVTLGAATPVTAAGLIAGGILEVGGFAIDIAGFGLVYKGCVDQTP
jgi:hypothetical protein